MKKFIIALTTILLVACTVKMSTTINSSDILSNNNKALMVDLQVYVMSCSEDNIENIKREFEKRKITARYNSCGSKNGFDDYASFSLPIALVTNPEAPVPVENGIYFFVSNDTLSLRTSKNFASMLDATSDFGSEKVNISSISFSLVNDGGSDFKITPTIAFVDEKPVFMTEINVPVFSKVLIQLPDVANKLLEQSDAAFPIFTFKR